MKLSIHFTSKKQMDEFISLSIANFSAQDLSLHFDITYLEAEPLQLLAKKFNAKIIMDYRDIRF